jgi:hypothetical protein
MLKLINIIKKDYVCERETIQSIRVEKTSVTLMIWCLLLVVELTIH